MLTAFTAGLLLITVSELGDKTFCIALLLAMRHRRRLVFTGVVAALAAMTLLSVVLGQSISFLPKIYIHHAAIALFLGCGLKLLIDAWRMPALASCEVAAHEAEVTLQQRQQGQILQQTAGAVILESFVLTFLAEWGDRTQIATVTLSATNNPIGVTLGAILGHTICALIAIIGGKLIAGRISERTVTAVGGALFILFAAIAVWDGGI
jgi:putative Ca2+/H+ antiporter (TMEM165/GDT1 family)